MNYWILLALSFELLLASVSSFHIPSTGSKVDRLIVGKNGFVLRPYTSVYSSLNDEESKGAGVDVPPASSATKIAADPQETSYPIDLPSPILLATSMVLAIMGTGSAFDLAGGSPNLGFGPTAAIAVVTIPLCLFLFYASILKATAETEADDREFMKGK